MQSNTIQTRTARRAFLSKSMAGVALVAPLGILAACGESMQDTGKSTTAQQTNSNVNMVTTPSIADAKSAFNEIMRDEHEHVNFLKDALTKAGATPRPKPTFKDLEQTDLNVFANLSRTFEDVGVGAYLMALPALSNKDYLAAAGSILAIEARHAGFLSFILDKPLSDNGAFDKPLSQEDIVRAASPFIVNLNGGDDPSGTLSSDVQILNFALLLEYLESEFFNINVPKLFP